MAFFDRFSGNPNPPPPPVFTVIFVPAVIATSAHFRAFHFLPFGSSTNTSAGFPFPAPKSP